MVKNLLRKADAIALLHAVWIVAGIVSLPLMYVISWWHYITLGFVGIMVLSWIVFRGCWFLQLENKWRDQMGQASPLGEQAFIQYYLNTFLGWHCSKGVVRTVNYVYVGIVLFVALQQL